MEKSLKDFAKDEFFAGHFALRLCNKRLKSNGEPYLLLEIGDASGRLPAVYWGADSKEVFDEIGDSQVVFVKGVVNEYRDKLQVTINEIRPALPEELDSTTLLPKGEFDFEELERRLSAKIESISDKWLSALIRYIFDDDKTKKKYLETPAGKLWHGAYIGGLAEHSINVAILCETTAGFFPICRRDLVVAGALLHDIGKIEELSSDAYFDYTIPGRLIGHIVIGNQRILEAISKIEGFPQALSDELSHMILSHHGSPEMGSPVAPMTIEACILHHSDLLEAQANAYKHIIKRDLQNPGELSKWVKPLGGFLYIDQYRDENGKE